MMNVTHNEENDMTIRIVTLATTGSSIRSNAFGADVDREEIIEVLAGLFGFVDLDPAAPTALVALDIDTGRILATTTAGIEGTEDDTETLDAFVDALLDAIR